MTHEWCQTRPQGRPGASARRKEIPEFTLQPFPPPENALFQRAKAEAEFPFTPLHRGSRCRREDTTGPPAHAPRAKETPPDDQPAGPETLTLTIPINGSPAEDLREILIAGQ